MVKIFYLFSFKHFSPYNVKLFTFNIPIEEKNLTITVTHYTFISVWICKIVRKITKTEECQKLWFVYYMVKSLLCMKFLTDGVWFCLTGNCAVLKPSEVSPACAELLERLIPEYLDPVCFPLTTVVIKWQLSLCIFKI